MQFIRTGSRALSRGLRPTILIRNTPHVAPLRCFAASYRLEATTRLAAPVNKSQIASYKALFAKRFSSTVSTANIAEATQVAAAEIKVTKPIVAYWLYFNAGLVFAIVVVGGLTRLTESGLSITEWNVISGMKPPRSQKDWEEEFEKYKQFPEYKL
jgi:hypothetical protein